DVVAETAYRPAVSSLSPRSVSVPLRLISPAAQSWARTSSTSHSPTPRESATTSCQRPLDAVAAALLAALRMTQAE
ncbi:hypothetical protein, partial [Ferrimicrobium sp.]|uniref:hypothetical protein n=1 Tax=Ferrimicrobium sp. TaxID=2926050 RepID=UPI00260A01B7